MENKNYRVGNLVDFMGQVEVIYQIRNSGVDFFRGKTKKGVITQSYVWESIKPILLTEEWHNKFGISKKSGVSSFEYYITDRKLISFSGDYVYLIDISRLDGERGFDDDICTLWNKNIKKRDMYVHEWQNLYFTLTGNEIQLK